MLLLASACVIRITIATLCTQFPKGFFVSSFPLLPVSPACLAFKRFPSVVYPHSCIPIGTMPDGLVVGLKTPGRFRASGRRIDLFPRNPREQIEAFMMNGNDDFRKNELEGEVKSMAKTYSYVRILYLLLALGSMNRFPMMEYGIGTSVGSPIGSLLSAGICHILQGATVHNRLGSKTYKRLNVLLMIYACMSTTLDGNVFVGSVNILSFFAAFRGLRRGILGWDDQQTIAGQEKRISHYVEMNKDIRSGARETFRGLVESAKNKEGEGYRAATLLFSAVNLLHNIPIWVLKITASTKNPMEVLARSTAIARMWLVSGICYTLKDAADRGRLGGSTFIQLNAMMAIWSFVAASVTLLPKFYPNVGRFKTSFYSVVIIMTAFSCFSGYQTIQSINKERHT